MRFVRPFLYALCAGAFSTSAAYADAPMPLFDAHVHYSRPAWEEVTTKDVFDAFDALGVDRALVSSTPDEGTLKLKAHAPERVVAFLRPYRTRADMATWFKDPDILAYVKDRLAERPYVGIGEFHLTDPDHADTSEIKALAKLAADKGLYLHSHSGAEAVRRLFAHQPTLKIVWAHVGMNEPVSVIDQMMDDHKNLWADMSFREWETRAEKGLNPAWEALLIKHADRFMMGSDTYVTERWFDYERIVSDHRSYLGKLPPDVAKKIAYENANRLFSR